MGAPVLSIRRLRLRTFAIVAATLVTGVGATASPVAAAQSAPLTASDTGLWIVQLAEPSLAAQQAPSGAVDVTTASARAYLDQLAARQAEVANLLSEELGRSVEVKGSYRNVLNAIVIEAEPAEVAGIAAVPGVVAVEPDVV